jgi:outer membrane protein assembly factor BamB
MPSRSGATPIIWNNRIFLNVALFDATGDLELWCVDRVNGQVLWKRPLSGGNNRQRKQNMSSPSPATDGTTVWVMTGTGIFKAFDFAGKELWSRDVQKDYGPFGLNWGYASSPLLHEGALYVQVLHGMKTDDPSYVMRIDKATGKTVWKVNRPTNAVSESPDSYTTPALVRLGNATEIVISGGDVVTGHDPETGKELWRANGLNPTNDRNYRIIASPVVAAPDVVIAPTRQRPMLALKPGGRGDVTTSHKLWEFNNGPDVPTPTSDGKYLYVVNDGGVVYCLDLRTGAPIYGPERLKPGTYSASPTLADGRLYITSEEGMASVFAAGPKFQILAENAMDEYTLSSIAVSQGQLFLRTEKHLYAIGTAKPGSP